MNYLNNLRFNRMELKTDKLILKPKKRVKTEEELTVDDFEDEDEFEEEDGF